MKYYDDKSKNSLITHYFYINPVAAASRALLPAPTSAHLRACLEAMNI